MNFRLVLVVFLPLVSSQEFCKTPKNETGVCTKLLRCPTLKSLIRRDITDAEKNYLRDSYCEGQTNDVIPQVCCHSLDVSLENCGWFSSSIFEAYLNPPSLDDFSWLVVIQEESEENTTNFTCLGTLINDLYVLTSARCFPQRYRGRFTQRYSVRLGDIELGITPDCEHDDCLDSEFNIPVAEIIKHRTNTIALVKLAESLVFERAISPICLFENVDDDLGRSKMEIVRFRDAENGIRQREKAMVETEECDGMICAGEERCWASRGGPLMKLVHHGRYNTRYTLVGVQSEGDCMQMKFTKVEPLLEWIRSKMVPY